MEKIEKYRNFLVDISQNHPNKAFFESVLSAYNLLFESEVGIKTVDTDEAEQLSDITKKITNISKEDQNKIYTKFIEIDPNKMYPPQPISMIFSKLKNMIIDLMNGRIGVDTIMGYLGQFN